MTFWPYGDVQPHVVARFHAAPVTQRQQQQQQQSAADALWVFSDCVWDLRAASPMDFHFAFYGVQRVVYIESCYWRTGATPDSDYFTGLRDRFYECAIDKSQICRTNLEQYIRTYDLLFAICKNRKSLISMKVSLVSKFNRKHRV